ncbi:MAG: 3-dehydro-L-gulonate 2-dehydrogenase [Sphaerochaetaceae bacterium]|nr:3-dehydro-L-gulonate 2-dehydrogenase [Sphaerochaetaceae bacterium]
MIIKYEELKAILREKLIKLGADENTAEITATIISENDLDGITSHGTGRFVRICEMIKLGKIKINNTAVKVSGKGSLEIWDGQTGPGPVNAQICMNRAMELSESYGIGCVALRNTNHWLRGATYGIQAAKKGFVGICWTNTTPNMPAWGTKEACTGNNPIVFSVPYKDSYIVMDGALAQFSYGALGKAASNGKQMPVDGGYDSEGKLTTEPSEILKTRRVLPIGFWKGSGISILLDMIVSGLSGGLCVPEIGELGSSTTDERNLSQIFIAIKADRKTMDSKAESIISFIKNSEPAEENSPVYIPGEQSLKRQKIQSVEGIIIDDSIWNGIENRK